MSDREAQSCNQTLLRPDAMSSCMRIQFLIDSPTPEPGKNTARIKANSAPPQLQTLLSTSPPPFKNSVYSIFAPPNPASLRPCLRERDQSVIFQCPECNRQFSKYHFLQSHLSSHSRSIRFVCRDCRRGYKRLQDWNRHERATGHQLNTQGSIT
ncbi:hypothetical protein BC830DRAFT_719419 [Chytriomyces sp. MP71]|nr:hypothetical protein BC830DRAFT_719419 [Chytriomyces sp. MP71]